MNAFDHSGPPDTALVQALATPFAWPQSGLEPLPWFPFTVAASRGYHDIAGRVAQRAERAYSYLGRLLGVMPRFRLLVLDRHDWPRFAEVATYGVTHFTADGNLVAGTAPADAWRDNARNLARWLPAPALRSLVKAHGRDAAHANAPDLRSASEALIVHEIARVLARQAGAAFARPWLEHVFASYALVAVLGETEPAALHRIGSLAEATRTLAAATPPARALGGDLAPFAAMLVQLALMRAAYVAYAEERAAPLARWFALARAGNAQVPDADHELGRMLARDVHPAIGALVAHAWCEPVPFAA